MNDQSDLIEANLLTVLDELASQSEVGKSFPPEMQSFSDQIDQLREYILEAGEYGVAYEVVVSLLEGFSFKLSGAAAVKLLEVGLLLKFKTENSDDAIFDSR